MKKNRIILGILLVGAGIFFMVIARSGLADDAGNPPSSKSSSTIGAWYDETWQASGFYRLEQVGSSDNYRYEYTTTPTAGGSPTTFVKSNTNSTNASLPQDVVVTEWGVTGHVHFSSGL